MSGFPPSTVSPCGRLRELILQSDQLWRDVTNDFADITIFRFSSIYDHFFYFRGGRLRELRLCVWISVSVTGKYKSKVRMTCFSFHFKGCYLLLEATAVLILLRCGITHLNWTNFQVCRNITMKISLVQAIKSILRLPKAFIVSSLLILYYYTYSH